MEDIIYKYIVKSREKNEFSQDLFELTKSVYEKVSLDDPISWKLLDELATISYNIGDKDYSIKMSDKLLQSDCFPESERKRITTFNRPYILQDTNILESKKLWDQAMLKIIQPPSEKTIWAKPSNTRLSVVMIEPRCHKDLKPVLWNMAHVYGGTDTVLYIFHGTKNIDYLKDITGEWINVEYVNMDVENLKWEEYSYKLTTYDFWNTIKTQYALIFQTDTLIFRKIDDKFFKFDYIGAYSGVQKLLNGGFSLRNVTQMKKITTEIGPSYPNGYFGAEDSYFSYYVHDSPNCTGIYPEFLISSEFSVERYFRKNPVGVHRPWSFTSTENIKCLLENVPGYGNVEF